MINLPALNTVAAYAFTSHFTTLNGIYTLTELATYSDALAAGINFVTSFYTPAGSTADQYATDAPSYQTGRVLKLVSVVNPAMILYAPEATLAVIPDLMVSCYNNVAIGVLLGVYNDPTKLAWILSELNSIILATTGINEAAKLFSLGTQYMKVSDYNALVATRTANQTAYTTLYAQLQAQIKQNTALQTLVSYYEASLIALAGGGS